MRKPEVVGVVAIALVAAVLGYGVRAARAGGIPTPNTMAYTGILTNTSGTPVASQGVTFSVWNAVSGGTQVCGPYTAVTTGSDGSFSVPLDAACVTAVHTTPNLWTQIQVTGEASPMPRTQIGAVPYAVEAARTVVAVDGGLYSVGATYCGSTAPQTGNLLAAVPGAANGYAAGKSLCATACSSPSAHMCSADDMIRSRALGVAVPDVTPPSWYAGGLYGSTTECSGWEAAGSGDGPAWGMFAGGQDNYYVSVGQCSAAQPVLCCD